jgi:DNA-binding GntR family transcriptional regulator
MAVSDEQATMCATIRELLEVLRELEALQASRAAKRAVETDKATLRSIICGMRAATRRSAPQQYWPQAALLHDAIHDVASHDLTAQLTRQLTCELAESSFVARSQTVDDSLWQHELIVGSIVAGDSQAAHSAMYEHMSVVLGAA